MTVTPRRTRHARRLCALALAATLLAGCDASADRKDDMAQASPLPSDAAATAAPALLESAGLALPPTADDVRVEAIVDDTFTDVTVTRFSAPRGEAKAMCVDAGHLYGEVPLIVAHEAAFLGITTEPVDGGVTLPAGTETCQFSLDTRDQVHVVVEPGEPATVNVLMYRFPSR